MKIAVLGAGAWGTAVACVLAPRHDVVLWGRAAALLAQVDRERTNARYLPGIALPPALRVATGATDGGDALADAVRGSDLVVAAVPTAALRATVRAAEPARGQAPLVWLCKGLERASGELPHQIVADELGESIAAASAGPLSGPSFAEEVARGLPVALTVAGMPPFCDVVTRAFHAGAMRVYSTDDVVGVEIGGAVKNVMAIATGIADALGLGMNARAALITRGLAEITRLGLALGARAETFMGLTGVGDLILTCTGALSRNRQVGLALGAGRSLDAALGAIGHVAEGVVSAPSVLARARALGVDMPITAAVCAVIEGRLSPVDALDRLLSREPKRENSR
jgi:glycerol-3-phosphate dehydrogenase (NAD(P)+)